MKKVKSILKYGLFFLIIVATLAFIFGPKYIDKSKNTTAFTGNVTPNSLLDSIPFIADLHCDALLWDRNILEYHDYGHVDIPRMQESNMAFQVFTIVSKVPEGINIIKNDANAKDQITQLNFLQLHPIKTWFSIKNRALNQCDRLHEFAEKSNGDRKSVV